MYGQQAPSSNDSLLGRQPLILIMPPKKEKAPSKLSDGVPHAFPLPQGEPTKSLPNRHLSLIEPTHAALFP